jgi:hypothetical protein
MISPEKISARLLEIATRIDRSKNPSRKLVAQDIRRVLAAMAEDYEDFTPAHGHAEDSGAGDAYKEYCNYTEEKGEEPVSFDDFKRGKK